MNVITYFIKTSKASIMAGLLSAIAFAFLAVWRVDNANPWTVFVVFTFTTLPIFVFGWKVLWFQERSGGSNRKHGFLNIENIWEKEAAAFAFWMLSGGMVFMETVGNAFQVSWMSPVGIIHFLVLGGVSFLGCYFWQKRTQG